MTRDVYDAPTFVPMVYTIDGETLSPTDLILRLGDGNPGAVRALIDGHHAAVFAMPATASEPPAFLADAHASKLRGTDLWKAYQYECAGDAAAFVRLVGLLAAAGGARS
jgi:hypothetical protein